MGLSMLFCKLETDLKTFRYLKEYLNFIKDNKTLQSKTILFLDNKIQHEELQAHLFLQSIDPSEDSNRKHKEIEEWIKNNAKSFRQYLSSIKLLACVSYTKGFKSSEDLSFDDFSKLCKEINELKNVLIDHIF